MSLGRFRQVLATPHVARLLLSGAVARMPIAVNGLAIILFLREQTGSFAVGGATVAALGIAAAVANPVSARLIDRHGQRAVFVPLAVGHAACLAALIGLGTADAATPLLVVGGFAIGATLPPVGTAVRPLLPGLLDETPALLSAAYALDSIAIELVFVAGPLLTAVLTGVASPQAALGVAGALVLIGTSLLVSTPVSRAWRGEGRRRGGLGALAAPGVRTLVFTAVPVGFCIGVTEVSLPAFADDMGSRSAAGVLLAMWSLGSAAGGVVYGARTPTRPLRATYVRHAAAFPLGGLLLVAATSIPVMGILIVVAGAGIAPLLTAANQLAGEVAPAGALTEAYTWPVTALAVGLSAGSLTAGLVVEGPGWRVALAVAAAAALAGAAIAYSRRDTLAGAAV